MKSPLGTNIEFFKGVSLGSKRLHYFQNGTGRDTYILNNHGGMLSDSVPQNTQINEFFNTLRGDSGFKRVVTERKYPHHQQLNLRTRNQSPVAGTQSPGKGNGGGDPFVDAQLCFQSPKVKKHMQLASDYQKTLDARLAMPKNLQTFYKSRSPSPTLHHPKEDT